MTITYKYESRTDHFGTTLIIAKGNRKYTL